MRRNNPAFGNLMGQHAPMQHDYRQGYGQQPMGYGGYPQQQQPGLRIEDVLAKHWAEIQALHSEVDVLKRSIGKVSQVQGQQPQQGGLDYRTPVSNHFVNEMSSVADRRYGSAPSFNPEQVPPAQQPKEEPVQEKEEEMTVSIEPFETSLPTKYPFSKRDLKFTKEVYKVGKESFNKIGDIVCDAPNMIDIEYLLGDKENRNFSARLITVRDYVKVSEKFIKENLIVPSETLHLVMSRLLDTIENEDELIYLHSLDRLLTNKLNEFLELNIVKVAIPSYASNYEELGLLIRDRIGVEAYKEFVLNFGKIINETVKTSFTSFIENKPEEFEDGKIPLIDIMYLVHVDKLSGFLGLDSNDIKYDEYKHLILKDDGMVEMFTAFFREVGPMKGFDNVFYITTKDGMVFKVIKSNDNKVFIKRFVTNF